MAALQSNINSHVSEVKTFAIQYFTQLSKQINADLLINKRTVKNSTHSTSLLRTYLQPNGQVRTEENLYCYNPDTGKSVYSNAPPETMNIDEYVEKSDIAHLKEIADMLVEKGYK